MGHFAGGTRHRAPGVVVWLMLLILASLPATATAADPRANDEAAIRAFHRRVSEIKRLMESEQAPEQPATAKEPERKTNMEPLRERRAEKVSVRPVGLPRAATKESPAPLLSATEPEEDGQQPLVVPEPLPELERLQLQALLAEDRLRVLEGTVGATRTLTILNLVLLAGISIGGGFLARRGGRKETSKATERPPAGGMDGALEEGIACYRTGRLEEALDHFNRALAQDPTLVPGYLWRGNLFFRLRQFGKAHHDYLRMFQLDPDNRSAFLSVVELYVTAGQYALALEILELGAPHRRGPEAEALFAFFEFAARSLAGLETTDAEAGFRRAMGEDFVLTWSLREIVRWLQNPEIPQDARKQIAALVRQLQARGGRLAGYREGGDKLEARGKGQEFGPGTYKLSNLG